MIKILIAFANADKLALLLFTALSALVATLAIARFIYWFNDNYKIILKIVKKTKNR